MGTVKVERVSNRLNDRRLGRGKIVRIEPTPNPFQKKQCVIATCVVKAATFTEKAVVETEIFNLPFMEAIRAAQARWPGKPISYRTLAPLEGAAKGEVR